MTTSDYILQSENLIGKDKDIQISFINLVLSIMLFYEEKSNEFG